MAAGYMTDRIGHGHDAQSEGERYAEQADPHLRKPGGDDGASASRKRQPERADRLGGIFLCVHVEPPRMLMRAYLMSRPAGVCGRIPAAVEVAVIAREA